MLTEKWLDGFLRRWPILSTIKLRALEMARAKAMQPEVVTSYYKELERVLNKYDHLDKPENIYNLDETGINTQHTPPKVLAQKGTRVQGITSQRSSITTVIGCVNALGSALPPFFLFSRANG